MLQDVITQTSRSHKKDERMRQDMCASSREDLTSQHALYVQDTRTRAKQQVRD